MTSPHFSALVETAYYPIPDIIAHKIKVLSGTLRVGDVVEAAVDIPTRKSIRKNHTATHLLHASLRQVLGDHVKQAGSLVSPYYLRFDFTHFAPLSTTEIREIENLINVKIRDAIDVKTAIVSLEEGLEMGAMAIFEEKYADKVRMVTIDEFSRELCGGIHVHNTGEIGILKIISESSIAAGMRRIEALSGEKALEYFQNTEDLLSDVVDSLNVPRKELLSQIEKLKDNLKQQEKEAKSLKQKLANLKYKAEKDRIETVKGIPVLVQRVEGLNMNELRQLADSLKQKLGSGVIILGAESEGKVLLVTAVTKDLIDRISAEVIIKKMAPLVDGGGGGRPDFAQAGGTGAAQLESTLEKSYSIIDQLIS
jgi:alanyl-tRNA synthetase